jgi:hypothetical protein
VDGYDPDRAPDPAEWLSADEDDRITLVQRWHRKSGARVPEPRLHALLHVVVESQAADGASTVPETLDRLVREGLTRHEALHAIAMVLAGIMRDALPGGPLAACLPD